MTKTETWKPVVGFEGCYEVSDQGRVKSFCRKKPKILRPGLASNGYLSVALGGGNTRMVHHLVTEAFLGARSIFMALHKDGCKTNNKADNLYWGTRSQNTWDALRHGTGHIGKSCLTEDEAISIICDDRLQKEIALDFGVTQAAVSQIKSGKTWQHLWGLSCA